MHSLLRICVLLILSKSVDSFVENKIVAKYRPVLKCIVDNGGKVIRNHQKEIAGTPQVLCQENDLSLDITTEKTFAGNIFVKGRAKDKSCRQSYANGGNNSYTLPLGQCGMQRLRSASPRGINFMVTVIVSFHPAGFITKNDRAFHVKCFYTEPEETVTSGLEVSMIPTTELADEMPMPSCEYSVRRDSVNGPALTFANVGETVFHVWECRGASMGMLVKKCFVTDGDGDEHAVVDLEGCSTDSFLLSELTYDASSMKAHATSQVFKYADSDQLYFTCQIRLCQKTMDMCQGVTPPTCHTGVEITNRTRRAVQEKEDDGLEVDVTTRSLLILDAEQQKQLESAPVCMPRTALPLVPVILATIIACTICITLAISRGNRRNSKVLDIDRQP